MQSRTNDDPLGGALRRASPFRDQAAVEAWDAWFRWRQGPELRDLDLDATAHRVANALAAVEGDARPLWTRRFEDAIASFRMLPDPRVLASAGTDAIAWDNEWLVAVVNVPMFVRAPLSELAAFNREAFMDAAELAVRAVDNAALLSDGAPGVGVGIGLIGIADALSLLSLTYDSDAGRIMAAGIARALAEGCLRASVRLACERGALEDAAPDVTARAARRGCPEALIEAAQRHGVRYRALTAITSEPRLSLFANGVADALDPLPGDDRIRMIAAQGGVRYVQSPGYARALRRRLGPPGPPQEPADEAAQRAMRSAVQPWIDADIDYPPTAEP